MQDVRIAPSRNTTPVGSPHPTTLLTASSLTPASFHLHSPWQRAGVLLVVYSTAQRCSALPRNSSSEQEIASSYLEFERRAYSPTTVAPSSNAYGLERSSARTMFTISWLNPSDKPNTACQCKAAPLALSSTERRAKEPFAWVRPPAPSKPTEATLGFDPAEKKLTPLPVLRYSSGHRKRWFKN